MKKFVCALLLVVLPAEAHAISRYRSTSLSCGEIRGTVRSQGAVIMRWTSQRVRNLPRYERVVADDRFCETTEIAASIAIPAADTANCPVLHCEQNVFDDDYLFRRHRR